MTSLTACDGAPRTTSSPAPTAPPEVRGVRVEIADEVRRAAADAGFDVEAAAHDAVARIDRRIELPVTTVEVVARPKDVIPEVGVGGFAEPGAGDVSIYVDPSRADFEGSLRAWLPAMLAHELHHAARIIDGPGYGDTLEEALVTEGLADVFSLEVFPGTPAPPWMDALPSRSVCRWWARARSVQGRSYDHDEWFFGGGDIPRWAGYSIGSALVRDHLRRHPGQTAADLVTAPARRVVRGVRLCP